MESNEGMEIGQSDAPRFQSSLYICFVRRRIHIIYLIPERMNAPHYYSVFFDDVVSAFHGVGCDETSLHFTPHRIDGDVCVGS